MKTKLLGNFLKAGMCFCFLLLGIGCAHFDSGKNSSLRYSAEVDWIRNGEPIEFENELWFPVDDMEILLDSEVYKVAEYKQVEVFVEKKDVRPYNRLYTKFDKNQFRYFQKKSP